MKHLMKIALLLFALSFAIGKPVPEEWDTEEDWGKEWDDDEEDWAEDEKELDEADKGVEVAVDVDGQWDENEKTAENEQNDDSNNETQEDEMSVCCRFQLPCCLG